ncbi:hypothetical protein [Thiomonas sp. FB-Cd]|uniref:hypothetical protein n=1 Tax=Thiomonas sp. FB-Cd TaxID=1158292 RepID=UPI001E37B850|nr:hypothetical protein [Thiomonas sp. FB-Cd]
MLPPDTGQTFVPLESSAERDLVECDRCHQLIARTACLTFEGADYIYHFCGPDCCSTNDAGQRSGKGGDGAQGIRSSGLPDIEAGRIAFLMARDGELAARQWVARTLAIYRRAVLVPAHFASTPEYRRKFILSYLSFRRWLSGNVPRGMWT